MTLTYKTTSTCNATVLTRPTWATGAVNQWMRIPNSTIGSDHDRSAAIAAGLLNSSGGGVAGGTGTYSQMFGYSGMCVDQNLAEACFFGSGGAGGWAGNDIPANNLLAATPSWRTRVTPSHQMHIYSDRFPGHNPHGATDAVTGQPDPYNGSNDTTDYGSLPDTATHPGRPYNRDGKPASPHAYWQQHRLERYGEIVTFGRANTHYQDSGSWPVIDKITDAGGVWQTFAFANTGFNYESSTPIFIDRRTDDVYIFQNNGLRRFRRSTETWTQIHSDGNWGHQKGLSFFDYTSGCAVRIGYYPYFGHPSQTGPIQIYDLTAGTRTPQTFTGANAAEFTALIGDWSLNYTGHCWCPDLGGEVVWVGQSAGGSSQKLFKIVRSGSTYAVTEVAMTGTPPAINESGQDYGDGLWGRMAYVDKLGGVVMYFKATDDAWFIRTR